MATVIAYLMNEIEYAVDNQFSEELLGGDQCKCNFKNF